jgi:hypothetical protein
MSRAILAIVAFAVLSAPALAQQRAATNPGTPGILREWPLSGVWGTALFRTRDTPDVICAVMTANRDPSRGDQYAWGIRQDRQDAAVVVTNTNSNAVVGPSIEVEIDGAPVGTYSITQRMSRGGWNGIRAQLSSQQAQRLVSMFRVGGVIKYITQNSTYSASLAGAPQAVANLNTCLAESTQLNRRG